MKFDDLLVAINITTSEKKALILKNELLGNNIMASFTERRN